MKCSRRIKALLSIALVFSLLLGTLPTPLAAVIYAKAEDMPEPEPERADDAPVSDVTGEGGWRYRVCADGNIELLGYEDTSVASLELPQRLDGRWVVRLSSDAFAENRALRHVAIPTSIGEIPETAFPNAESITIRGYNGSAAMSLTTARGFAFDNRSEYDFFEDVLDLSEMKSAQWSFGGSTLTVSMPYASLLREGGHMFLPPGNYSRTGFAVKVESVAVSEGGATARVSELGFPEVVRSYHVKDERLYIDYDNIRILSDGFSLDSSQNDKKARGKVELSGNKDLSFNAHFTLCKGVTVKGTIGYGINATASVDYASFHLDGMSVSLEQTVHSTIVIQSAVSKDRGKDGKEWSKKEPLAEIPLATNGILSVNLKIYAIVRADGSVTITSEIKNSVEFTYKDGVFTKEKKPDQKSCSISIAVSGALGVGVGIDFRIGFSVPKPFRSYAIRVCEVEAELTLELAAESKHEVPFCWDVSVSLHFALTARAGILNLRDSSDQFLFKLLEQTEEDESWRGKLYVEATLWDGRIKWTVFHWEGPEERWVSKCTREDAVTATFNFMYDGLTEESTVEKNGYFLMPEIPDREGYAFKGWYTDTSFTRAWSFTTPATEDITLYAKWEKEPDPTPTPTPKPTETTDPGTEPTSTPTSAPSSGGYTLKYSLRSYYDNALKRDVKFFVVTDCIGNPRSVTIPAWHWDEDDKKSYPVKGIDLRTNATYSHQGAFENCTALVSVSFPSSLEFIGWGAFYGCSSLASVSFPSSLKSIGNYAFWGCSSLVSVRIPENLRRLEDRTFAECTSLANVYFSGDLEYIDYGVFRECTSLREIDLPDSITEIEDDVFTGCSSLERVHLPSGLRTIPEDIFWGCSSLKEINIPRGLVRIEECAFIGCSSLEHVDLPDTLAYIGDYAFGSSGLKELNIPQSVESIEYAAFHSCQQLSRVDFADGCTATIGYRAFSECANLTEITIPASLTAMAGDALSYCRSLTSVYVPDSVEIIAPGDTHDASDYNANSIDFSFCESLRSLRLPDIKVYFQGDYSAFMKWSQNSAPSSYLYTVVDDVYYAANTLFDGDKYAHSAFYRCSSLTDFVVPNGIPVIPEDTFYYCENLVSVILPDTVKEIGDRAFHGCNNLKNIVLPDGIKKIGEWAFWGCEQLESLALPDNVTKIGEFAFVRCGKLSAMYLPDSVTEIGTGAFIGCDNLATLYLPKGLTKLEENLLYGCDNFSTLLIWDSVTSIEDMGLDANGVYKFYVETLDGYPANYFREHYPNAKLIPIGAEDSVVSFNAMGGECAVKQVLVEWGDPVPEPAAPTREDYTFTGWYTDVSCTVSWNFDTEVKANLTLYAGWDTNEALLDYDLGDGGALITDYQGEDREVTVPREIDGFPVTGIGPGVIGDEVCTLTLPATVTDIAPDAFRFATNLTTIRVAEGNPVFRSVDGVLFRGDELVCYPAAHKGSSYDVPDGTTAIGSYAFMNASRLKTLSIPASVGQIGDYAVYACGRLEAVRFAADVAAIGAGNFRNCANGLMVRGPVDAAGLEAYADDNAIAYNEYNVGFVIDGELKAITQMRAGSMIEWPVMSSTERMEFIGWATDPLCRNLWTGTTMPEEDLLLYAAYRFEFLYDVNEDGEATLTRYGGDEAVLTVPTVIDGYPVVGIAAGCFRDKSITLVGEKGGFVEEYAEDYDLAFRPITYTLSFDTNGGEPVESMQFAKGDRFFRYDYELEDYVSLLPVPIRQGYAFKGWYTSNTASSPIGNYSSMGAADQTLYARWDVVAREGDFEFCKDESYREATLTGYVGAETAVTVPAEIGGYKVVAIADGCFPDKSVTLVGEKGGFVEKYAKAQGMTFAPILHTLSFDTNGGEPVESMRLAKGDSFFRYDDELDEYVSLLPVPIRQGYAFRGWYWSNTSYYPIDEDDAMEAEDLMLYARWDSTDFEYEIDDWYKEATLIKYHGTASVVTIPGRLGGYEVVAIAEDCFPDKSVTLVGEKGSVVEEYAEEYGLAFQPITYTLSFDTNGGEPVESMRLAKGDSFFRYDDELEEYVSLLPVPVRQGYAFKGWYASNTDRYPIDRYDEMEAADRTFYARWDRADFEYEVDAWGEATLTRYVGGETRVTVPAEYEGYEVVAIAEDCFPDRSVTLVGEKGGFVESYANAQGIAFEPITHLLSFETNGGEPVENMRFANGDRFFRHDDDLNEYVSLLPVPIRQGYRFGGWYTSNSFYDSYRLDEYDNMGTRDKTVYARWYGQKLEGDCVYETDDWREEATLISYRGTASAVTVPERVDGYKVVAIAEDCFPDKSITLMGEKGGFAEDYAEEYGMAFELILHTLSFDTNGGEPVESMRFAKDDSFFRYDDELGIYVSLLPVPIRQGYVFKGWYASNTDRYPIDRYDEMGAEDQTLYAGWDIIACEGSYEYRVDERIRKATLIRYLGTETSTTVPTVIGGYNVVAIAEDCFPDKSITLVGEKGGFAEEYAEDYGMAFEPILHTLSFDTNGGEPVESMRFAKGDSFFRYDDDLGIYIPLLPRPIREGYEFKNWYASDTDYEPVDEYDRMEATDKTLYARWYVYSRERNFEYRVDEWEGKAMLVSYLGAGGTVNIPTTIGGYEVVAIANFCFPDESVTLVGEKGGFVERYADDFGMAFIPILHTLTFDTNGGERVESMSFAKGDRFFRYDDDLDEYVSLLPIPIRHGYAFRGWYASNTDRYPIDKYSSMGAADQTLYAGWERADFEYEVDDREEEATLTRYLGVEAKVTIPTKIRDYMVVGIAENCFADKSITLVGEKGGFVEAYATAQDIAFEPIMHTLSFEADGGEPIEAMRFAATDPLTGVDASDHSVLPIPEKPGYGFEGWYTEDGWMIDAMPEYDLTVHATWTPVYNYTITEEGLTITGYTGGEADLAVPEAIDGIPVVAIAPHAFAGNRRLESVALPASLTRIGKSAFEGSKLVSITLLGETEIGTRAFYGCDGLMNVTLSNGLSVMGEYAFAECRALLNITLPDSLQQIPEGAFFGCEWLSEVVMPSELEIVGKSAFYGCNRLREAAFGANVCDITMDAFDGCAALSTFKVDDANPYYSAADGVLFNKAGNTLIRYPEGRREETYMIPDGVTLIGSEAMKNSRIKRLIFGANCLTLAEKALQNSALLSEVVLNDGVEEIGKRAFASCLTLKAVDIPQSLAVIGVEAFMASGLKSISIPAEAQVLEDAVPENQGMTIYGVRGTSAHTYAVAHEIRFVDMTADIPVTGIRLPRSMDIAVRENLQLQATLEPQNATETDISWSVADSSIVRVDSRGNIFGRRAGTTKVTATAANGSKAYCVVTVGAMAYEDIDINQADFWIPSGMAELGDECFMGIDARFVVIPANCRSIGSKAFADCPNLEIVYFAGSNDVVLADDFLDGSEKARVYAPAGSNMAGWRAP